MRRKVFIELSDWEAERLQDIATAFGIREAKKIDVLMQQIALGYLDIHGFPNPQRESRFIHPVQSPEAEMGPSAQLGPDCPVRP